MGFLGIILAFFYGISVVYCRGDLREGKLCFSAVWCGVRVVIVGKKKQRIDMAKTNPWNGDGSREPGRRKRMLLWGAGILLLVAAGSVSVWFFGFSKKGANVQPAVRNTVPLPDAPQKNTDTSAVSSVAPNNPIDTQGGGASAGSGSVGFSSEHYRVGEIVFGGEAEFFGNSGSDSIGPLVIDNVRGESFLDKSGEKVKLMLSWTTSNLATSEVRYGKSEQESRVLSDDGYSLSHSMVLSDLEPASTYLYTVVGKDKRGGEMESETHMVLTPSKSVSLFDLIANAFGDTFGWMKGK